MRKIALMLCLLMMAAGLSGCIGGNETEISTGGDPIVPGELPDDWPTYSVPTVNDLPTCDSTTLGRLYYVESPPQFQVCKSSGWAVLDLSQLSVLENSFPSMTLFSYASAAVDDNDGTWSADVELEILALDVDGQVSSLGVDLNLDGTVDIDFTSTLGLGTSTNNPAHLSVTFPMPLEQSLYLSQEGAYTPCQLRLYNVFALMLGDDDGGITTELITIYPNNDLLGVWSGMVNGFNSYGILDTLQISATHRAWLDGSDLSSTCIHLPEFSITDHPSTSGSNSGDNLVRVEIISVNDLASLMQDGYSFSPSITTPADCAFEITFDGADENNPQSGDAWIISEQNSASGNLCAPSSPSTVIVQFGLSGMGPFGMAYQEVVVT